MSNQQQQAERGAQGAAVDIGSEAFKAFHAVLAEWSGSQFSKHAAVDLLYALRCSHLLVRTPSGASIVEG